MINREFGAGIIMLVIGLLVAVVLIPHGVKEPSSVQFAALSPSYYPRIVAAVLSALGAVIILRSFIVPAPSDEQKSDRRSDAAVRTLFVFALLAGYGLTLPWLGFILGSAIAMWIAFFLAGEKRLHITLPLAILIPLGLYFFFLKVAKVPIPLGVLEPLLQGI